MVSLYLAKRFITIFFLVTGIFSFIIFTVSYGGFIRRFIEKTTWLELLLMSLAGLPEVIHNFLDFIIGIAVVVTLYRLNKASELLILRAQGRSGLSLIMPFVVVAGLIGLFDALALSPFGRITNNYVYQVKQTLKHEAHVSDVYGRRLVEPVALHQHDGKNSYVIKARRDRIARERLYDVSLFRLNEDSELHVWYQADRARLSGAEITLYNVTANGKLLDDLTIPAHIITNDVSNFEGLAPAQDFWRLFSLWLNVTEMQTVNKIAFQTFLARPFLLMGVVLFAAAFMLPFSRHGAHALKISASLTVIFILSLLFKLFNGFGESGIFSAFVSLWMPPALLIGLSLSFILHAEER